MFVRGQLYRRKDIHDSYGGSRQSGISPSKDHPFVFLFTGSSGAQFGYDDHWDDDGMFIYCGDGQVGDMEFIRGNRAVRDHIDKSREIHLFESSQKSGFVRYLGEFSCAGWHKDTTPDREGNERVGIFFHLMPIEEFQDIPTIELEQENQTLDIADLRNLAYDTSLKPAGETSLEGRRRIYKRSKTVRDYVLARSEGRCEGCGSPAPFKRRSGEPYLEPHHILRVSDGGPDSPDAVIALCPNCHRRVHNGEDGESYNQDLKVKLSVLENRE